MSSTQRRVIELTRLRELSNKEAAQVLELSEQTVKNQLSIGLKTLRQELSRLAVPLWLLFFINRGLLMVLPIKSLVLLSRKQ